MSGSNRKTAMALGAVVVGMTGLAFAAVPLYDMFCRATGFGGTPLRADAASHEISDELITVRFDASVDRRLGWEFTPVQRELTVRMGETGLAFYEAHNPTSEPIVGTAAFNVAPLKAAPHFMKIDCFCFTEQLLQPGERVQMPVTFFIDPEMRRDHLTEELESVTLSYTFYRDEDATADLAYNPSKNNGVTAVN